MPGAPKKREDGLIVRVMDEETLVYDRRRHKAHCLNRAAAWVWRHCDGATSAADLAKRMHEQLAMPGSEQLVRLALDRLARAHLLAAPLEPAGAERLSRRDLARKLGIAAVAVPLVMTILAPTAAAAASVCGGRAPCHGKVCANRLLNCVGGPGGICRCH